jgi:hypothetical protein
MTDFWKLTDSEIRAGMELTYDKSLATHAIQDHHPQCAFIWDSKLQKMAAMLADCGWDRDLMRLKYADELAEMQKPRFIQWNGSAALKMKMKDTA